MILPQDFRGKMWKPFSYVFRAKAARFSPGDQPLVKEPSGVSAFSEKPIQLSGWHSGDLASNYSTHYRRSLNQGVTLYR